MGKVSAAALAAGKPGVVAALSAVLASPREGHGAAPAALAAVAGRTLVEGVKGLGRAIKHAVKDEE